MTSSNLQGLINNLTCGDNEVAEKSVRPIAALGESALPALFDLLDSADVEKRWWALRTLALIPHPDVQARLQAGLRDPDPAVRQCAALGMSQQPLAAAIPDLIALLEDEDRLLARLAGDALIAAGEPAVPALIAALESGTQTAQIEAARALALIEDTSAIPTLFKAWQEGSTMSRYWAEEGLDRMGVGMQFFVPG